VIAVHLDSSVLPVHSDHPRNLVKSRKKRVPLTGMRISINATTACAPSGGVPGIKVSTTDILGAPSY
jgi:hypothetical protein